MTREDAIKALTMERKTALHENKQAFDMAIKALEQEPTTKNDLGIDCISRADARKAIIDHQYSANFCEEHNIDHSINTGMALIALSDLPSVTPQEPKTGHWKAFIHNAYHGIDEDGEPIWREVTVYHCSQCNRRTVIKEKFCPNCGADMRGE